MKNNASLVYNVFLVVGDFLALVAAFVSAYILRVTLDPRPLADPIPAMTYLGVFLALAPLWLLLFALLGLYNNNIYEKRFSELGRLFMGSFVGLLFVISYAYMFNKAIFPARLVPVYGFLLGFTFLVLFRNLARVIRNILFMYDIGITNLLIIGDTPATDELYDLLHDSRHSGYRIVGIVGKSSDNGRNSVRRFATFEEAADKLGSDVIHSIVQTELYSASDKNTEILRFAQERHIAYRFIPGNSELFVGNIAVELFQSSVPVIAVHQTALLGWGRIVKRLFDFFVSLAVIIVLSPLFVLISVLILLFDPGPVFFRQERITRFNTRFRIFKFRTHKMKYSGLSPEEAFAKMGRSDLIERYRANGDQLPHDPRVSAIGRILRRTSLDELPQLFNVLIGDISLVGPRALVPEEINAAKSKHHIVSVKSGITGLAQVSGRRDIDYAERRKLDLYYVQNWSFWLDVVILFKTLRVVLMRTGAK